MKRILKFLAASDFFAPRAAIKGSGGPVKEQTHYYYYQ
jgi:hypothetical protein